MKLVFHGTLREMYGESFIVSEGTPAQTIEGFFSQQPDHPREMIIDAVGFDTIEKLEAQTDKTEIHLVPAMFGGGGNFGKILIGGALIGLAIALPGLGTGLSIGLMSMLSTTLISIGAGLALQGVMGIFFKTPTASKDEDPDPSRYLGIGQNTTAQGTPLTVACGRIQVAGHWLSLQSDADKIALGKFPAVPA